MGQIIRIVEVDPASGNAKEPRVGVNGSVEVFAVPEPLASDLIEYVEIGRVSNLSLLDAIADTRLWLETLLSRRRTTVDVRRGLEDLGSAERRILAAQCLRMRYEHLKIRQIEGVEAGADYEIHWCVA